MKEPSPSAATEVERLAVKAGFEILERKPTAKNDQGEYDDEGPHQGTVLTIDVSRFLRPEQLAAGHPNRLSFWMPLGAPAEAAPYLFGRWLGHLLPADTKNG